MKHPNLYTTSKRIINSFSIALVLTAFLAGCSTSNNAATSEMTSSVLGTSEGCSSKTFYTAKVEFVWTASQHPSGLGDFPAGAHFSSLIGSVHQDNESFYSRGSLASQGIENMAETGSTSPLSTEIDQQVIDKTACYRINGSGNGNGTGEVTISQVAAGDNAHYLTIVSMIAPSPDWFIAARNINLKDSNGAWRDTITVNMPGYDAGTDDGATFTAANADSNPKQTITLFADNATHLAVLTLTRNP